MRMKLPTVLLVLIAFICFGQEAKTLADDLNTMMTSIEQIQRQDPWMMELVSRLTVLLEKDDTFTGNSTNGTIKITKECIAELLNNSSRVPTACGLNSVDGVLELKKLKSKAERIRDSLKRKLQMHFQKPKHRRKELTVQDELDMESVRYPASLDNSNEELKNLFTVQDGSENKPISNSASLESKNIHRKEMASEFSEKLDSPWTKVLDTSTTILRKSDKKEQNILSTGSHTSDSEATFEKEFENPPTLGYEDNGLEGDKSFETQNNWTRSQTQNTTRVYVNSFENLENYSQIEDILGTISESDISNVNSLLQIIRNLNNFNSIFTYSSENGAVKNGLHNMENFDTTYSEALFNETTEKLEDDDNVTWVDLDSSLANTTVDEENENYKWQSQTSRNFSEIQQKTINETFSNNTGTLHEARKDALKPNFTANIETTNSLKIDTPEKGEDKLHDTILIPTISTATIEYPKVLNFFINDRLLEFASHIEELSPQNEATTDNAEYFEPVENYSQERKIKSDKDSRNFLIETFIWVPNNRDMESELFQSSHNSVMPRILASISPQIYEKYYQEIDNVPQILEASNGMFNDTSKRNIESSQRQQNDTHNAFFHVSTSVNVNKTSTNSDSSETFRTLNRLPKNLLEVFEPDILKSTPNISDIYINKAVRNIFSFEKNSTTYLDDGTSSKAEEFYTKDIAPDYSTTDSTENRFANQIISSNKLRHLHSEQNSSMKFPYFSYVAKSVPANNSIASNFQILRQRADLSVRSYPFYVDIMYYKSALVTNDTDGLNMNQTTSSSVKRAATVSLPQNNDSTVTKMFDFSYNPEAISTLGSLSDKGTTSQEKSTTSSKSSTNLSTPHESHTEVQSSSPQNLHSLREIVDRKSEEEALIILKDIYEFLKTYFKHKTTAIP